MAKAIEYGVREKASGKTIEHGVRGKGKSVQYGIKTPSADFDRRNDVGHSPDVNPNP